MSLPLNVSWRVDLSVPALSLAQVIFGGGCPTGVTVKQNFDPTKYIGKWYEFERFFFVTEYNDRCVSANYTLKENGHVKVFNQGINKDTGAISSAIGDAFIPNKTESAKLQVQFQGGPPGPYWVLDTDYTTYTVIWSCLEPPIHLAHAEITWILTRDRAGLTEAKRQEIYTMLKNFKIDPSKFQRIDQTNCSI